MRHRVVAIAFARSSSLPIPGAVLSVEPGRSRAALPWVKTPLADLSLVEAGTLLVTLAGSSDNIAGPFDAIRIFRETTSVLPDDKNSSCTREGAFSAPTGLPPWWRIIVPASWRATHAAGANEKTRSNRGRAVLLHVHRQGSAGRHP